MNTQQIRPRTAWPLGALIAEDMALRLSLVDGTTAQVSETVIIM